MGNSNQEINVLNQRLVVEAILRAVNYGEADEYWILETEEGLSIDFSSPDEFCDWAEDKPVLYQVQLKFV